MLYSRCNPLFCLHLIDKHDRYGPQCEGKGMKKLCAILFLVTLLLLSACVSFPVLPSGLKISPSKEEGSPLATTVLPTTTTTSPALGARRNPTPLGVIQTVCGHYGNGDLSFDIMLSNPIRGDEALELAKKWNMFNSPGDGEFLIVDAELFLEKWEHKNDKRFYLSDWDFDYFTEDYNRYVRSIIVVSGAFRVDAYEGATVKGKLAFLIPKDDNGYIVLYDKFWWKIAE